MDKQPHALVTGASSGIGAAIVEHLLRDGWRVTGISRRPGTFAHPAFEHLSLDLNDVDSIAGAVADIAPTALVHAAGLLKVGSLGSLDHDDGAAMWRLHVDVAERLADALAPRLPQGGRIIFIGSRTASAPPVADNMPRPKRRWSRWRDPGRANSRRAALRST